MLHVAKGFRLKDAVEFAVYTPGSDAGLPVSILASLSAPPIPWEGNKEILREKISSTVTALLGLIGFKDIDPVRSKEHILLSNIFEAAWREGKDLDMGMLITHVQSPPFEKLGVLSLDQFYPEKERFELAMLLNNFLAAPAFQTWMEGQPLDIGKILFTPSGKPRHSVFYLAHLSDQERMFFVTLLYSSIETWMRTQKGSGSLRVMVYFDEIAGYLPPVANPPSKNIILRMLKQARAFGVGLILATQNPVDLDYKALSNAGTWMIGKLQTEQDKANAKSHISIPEKSDAEAKGGKKAGSSIGQDVPPAVPGSISVSYFPAGLAPSEALNKAGKTLSGGIPEPRLLYRPALAGQARVAFLERKYNISVEKVFTVRIDEIKRKGLVRWENFQADLIDLDRLSTSPQSESVYETLDNLAISDSKYVSGLKTDFLDWIYRTQAMTIRLNEELDVVAGPDISDEEFQKMCQEAVEEKQEAEIEALKAKYEDKLDKLEDKLRDEIQDLDEDKQELSHRRMEEVGKGVENVLGLFTGRRRSLTTSLTKRRMTSKAKLDMKASELEIKEIEEEIQEMEAELKEELEEVSQRWKDEVSKVTEEPVTPFKKNIFTEFFGLVWLPYYAFEQDSGWVTVPAYKWEILL